MSKQLPSIFKNSSDKKINNNKRVFYSKYESIGNVIEREDAMNNEIDLSEFSNFSLSL